MRLRLPYILLAVNLAVLLLPLGSLYFFRIYENELVRQTEIELIAQAATIGAVYKSMLADQLNDEESFGKSIELSPLPDEHYTPIPPQLDLARTKINPPRPDGLKPSQPVDPRLLAMSDILSAVLHDTQRTTLAGLKILDYAGTEIAGNDVGLSYAHVPEIRQALDGSYVSIIRQRISDSPTPALASISRGTGIRVFVAYPIVHQGQLWGIAYLSRTPKNILKHLYAERHRVIFIGVFILFVTCTLAVVTSLTISRPINKLIGRTKKIAAGDRSAITPLSHPGTAEIDQLSRSFCDMASALDKRSTYIKDFATHLSHEIKTPLTSIQGAAELMLDHLDEMEPDKKQKFLNNIITDSGRLRALVSRLMELAKADHIAPAGQACDAAYILHKLRDAYKDKGIKLVLPPDLPGRITMDEQTLQSIFINLLDNASQHGADEVRLNVQRRDGHICVHVKDNGTGISTANLNKIFTPFFTTKRDKGGTGLGLGIVQSLLGAHGGDIDVMPSEDGAHFVLMLRGAT